MDSPYWKQWLTQRETRQELIKYEFYAELLCRIEVKYFVDLRLHSNLV